MSQKTENLTNLHQSAVCKAISRSCECYMTVAKMLHLAFIRDLIHL